MNIFEQYLYLNEAPGDEESPPDIGEEAPPEDMPDIDDGMMDNGGDMPDMPDMPDMNMDGDMDMDMGGGDMGDGGFSDEQQGDNGDLPDENLAVNDKVSLLMNVNLYNHYLSLRDKLRSELSATNNNKDILFSLSDDIVDIIKALDKLEDNLSTYMRNLFNNESYSKNLLFFNKCVNLYNLIIDNFNDVVKEGIRKEKE